MFFFWGNTIDLPGINIAEAMFMHLIAFMVLDRSMHFLGKILFIFVIFSFT